MNRQTWGTATLFPWILWMDLVIPRLHGHMLHQAIGGAVATGGGFVLAIANLFAAESDAITYLGTAGAGAVVTGLLAAANAFYQKRNEDRIEVRKHELAKQQLELEYRRQQARERELELQEAATVDAARWMREMNRWAVEARQRHKSLPLPPEMPDLPDVFRELARRAAADSNISPAPPSLRMPPPNTQGGA